MFRKQIYLLCFSLFLISLSLTTLVTSQIYVKPDAEIIELYVCPETPIIAQTSEITIKIKNIGEMDEPFMAKLYVLKNGNIKLEKSFEFKIKPNKIWMVIEKFTPDSVGIHKIRAEVWDASKFRLFGAKTIDVMVRGDIGPFDASIDVITTYPYPGKGIFAIINLLNKGTKEVDVTVNYKIEGTMMSGKYMAAPEPESESSRIITMSAPSEPGIYNLSVDVEHEGSPVASAAGNFYVVSEEYTPVLEIEEVPPVIELKQGESKSFSIKVSNIGDFSVSNLYMIVRGISSGWVEVWPSSPDLEPGRSRVFLVNFNIPKKADTGTYPLEFVAVGKETYKSDTSALTVLESEVTGVEKEVSKLSIFQVFSIVVPIVGVTLLIIILVTRSRWRTMFPQIEMPKETSRAIPIPPSIQNLAFLDLHDEWRDMGLVIGLDFVDTKGNTLSFKDVEVDVTVNLFTTKTDPNTLLKRKDRIIHKGTVTVKSNRDLSISAGKGILIPKEEINVNPERDEQYGILEITVRTPEGRGFFAKDESVKLY